MDKAIYLLLLFFGGHVAAVDDAALVTEIVYLDLSMGGNHTGRVEIGLFGATSPKTVRNFVGLVNHEVSLVQLFLHSSIAINYSISVTLCVSCNKICVCVHRKRLRVTIFRRLLSPTHPPRLFKII